MRLRNRLRFSSWVLSSALLLGEVGCSAYGDLLAGPGGSYGGEFGATVGGVKDLRLARELIGKGVVPTADAFLVEAMFAEHDLPLTGAPCTKPLCLRGAAGIAPDLDGVQAGWAQLGLSSGIDPATFVRPSLSAILCVDVSGSMGWEGKLTGGTLPTAGRLSYLLLKQLATRLGAEDRVALVTYGSSVSTVVPLTRGDDPALGPAIESLRTAGSTNMEAGLRRAYELGRSAQGQTQAVRIFLFTDENPNVGATSETEFSRIVTSGEQEGSALTVFGLGPYLRSNLMNAMAVLRGANGYSLTSEEHVPELLAESWPWMASPLAYDLKVTVQAQSGFALANTYGFPQSGGASPQLEARTVFLSRKRGGLLLQLTPPMGGSVLDFAVNTGLSYTALTGAPISESLNISAAGAALDGRGRYAAQPSVAKATALAILVSSLRKAAELYRSDAAAAIALMMRASTRISEDATALADPSLDVEVKLAKDLLQLMQSGARQGTM
jgi:Ca-activated chloride channel family protein